MAVAFLKFFKPMKVGAGGIFRFIRSNWYIFLTIFVLIPVIFSSISTAIETQNPAYPFLQLGIHLTNADKVIYDDVQILKENPAELIGMEKPTEGIWKNACYYWMLFKNVLWKFFGLIWLITFPFVVIFKILRLKNVSEVSKNIFKTIIYGLIFIFIINLILAVHGLATESIIYTFPESIGIYQKTWLIIMTTLPFHGLASLIMYLTTLF